MDPDKTLADLREAIKEWATAVAVDDSGDIMEAAARIANTAGALDQWLTNGGFLPAAWRANR